MKKIGFIIIGDEILSGKTRDINLQTLATLAGEKGYQIGEVRIVPDEEDEIIKSVRELKEKYFLVITSGGIGPTHDDITTESVAKALNIELELHKEAEEELKKYYNGRNIELNEARLKMAKLPKRAEIIFNIHTGAPGFKIENICVLAGIPLIFKSCLEEFLKTMEDGVKMHFLSLETKQITEGMIATELGKIQKEFAGVVFIGSYPKIENGEFSLQITFRSVSLEKAEECKQKVLSIINVN
jgi:molybdenum cofactor synthesis domain-containing protein